MRGKNNKIKVDFNVQRKTCHGVFPCEILDVIQWKDGKGLSTGEGREGGKEESILESLSAKVCF